MLPPWREEGTLFRTFENVVRDTEGHVTATVMETDRAWSEDTVERTVIEAAGHRFLAGPTTPPSAAEIEELVRMHTPQAIMTCWAVVSEAAVRAAPDLQIVQRIGVGLDNIAVAAATARGSWVANVPDYCVGEVADHAIALLLAWARGVTHLDRDVKAGNWNPASASLRRVADLTVGIVGLGRIGLNTAAKLKAFGCRVLGFSPSTKSTSLAEQVSFEALLSTSDVVIVHAPLTAATKHMFNEAAFARMKPGAFLINVSRGAIVDTAALFGALDAGRLSGAGLDVVEGEPDPPRELLDRDDVIVSPHIAFSSDASLIELRRRSAEEVVRVLAGETPHYPCNQPKTKA